MPEPFLVDVGGAHLAVELLGEGEPVVVIATALVADELRPLARGLAAGGHRVVHQHRRGYGPSGPAPAAPSVAAEAADSRAVLEALGTGPVHVVGASFSAAVALAVAASAPGLVRSLTVVEPPPAGDPGFVAANERLLADYRARGAAAALEGFLTMLSGPAWRQEAERLLPGSVAALERDAGTFLGCDVPALAAWRFGAADAARVRCPVLHVGGAETPQWFREARDRLVELLPQARTATVEGAGHQVALTHAEETARLVLDFLPGAG